MSDDLTCPECGLPYFGGSEDNPICDGHEA